MAYIISTTVALLLLQGCSARRVLCAQHGACVGGRVGARAASARPRCAPPACAEEQTSLVVTAEVFDNVKRELWRTSQADPAAMVKEQREVIGSLLGQIEALPPRAANDGDPLNVIVAPHLPVLLTLSFPQAAREALATCSEEERPALLSLSKFVMTVQAEIGEALIQLQLRQVQKLRELCDAATDGGTEQVMALAEAMKEELDTDFCNYLNYAIEREETRLREAGATPFVPSSMLLFTLTPSS